MTVTIVPIHDSHIPTLGRICFEAFGALQDRHGVERDFDSVDVAQQVVGLFASRPDFAAFMAVDERAEPLGSNFLCCCDAGAHGGVAGVGPITIRPDAQSHGAGRALMIAALDEARRRGIARVRLMQETINTASLSLYTKLGFDWRECVALVRPAAAASDVPGVEAITESHMPEIDALSRRHYHHTRVQEARMLMSIGLQGFVLRRAGVSVGYFFPSFLGHGFAATAHDMANLIGHAMRHAPPPFRKTLLPLGQHELHRLLLERGSRAVKVFNYMSVGPFEAPSGAWMPSVGM